MTTPVSIPAGHKLVATDFDAYENLTAVWTSYAPTWASFGTQPAIGDGSLTGRSIRVGKFMAFKIVLIPGASTTYGTLTYVFSLPAVPVANQCCTAWLHDTSTGFRYAGAAVMTSGTAQIDGVQFTNGTTGFSGTSPITLATTDFLIIEGLCEVA